ncbi:MAG: hypothetical protein JWL64_568 [Frankiales bacterium]|nr:hypothetical protein [Frankiales bacterium]
MTVELDRAARRQVDETYFRISDAGELQLTFDVSQHLARGDGQMFGGAAAGLCVAAIERFTGRDVLWSTTQFVSLGRLDDRLTVTGEVLAQGRSVSQVRLTALSPSGKVVFTGSGAAATQRPQDAGPSGQFRTMPDVAAPEQSVPVLTRDDFGEVGWHTEIDARLAAVESGGHAARLSVWVRFPGDVPLTPARLTYAADLVPLTVARACGVTSGVSLDNTVRLLTVPDTDWILVDLHPAGAWGGYGTGTALLWAEDGTLMGQASQSASIFAHPWDFFTKAAAALTG